MDDTAQLERAAETDPNAQLETAAQAFLEITNPTAAKPRGDDGRFIATEPENQGDETDEAEADEAEAGDVEAPDEDELEAAETDEDTAQPMPPSWPEDQLEVWRNLPAEAQAVITARDAEQLRETNNKFQEIANVRKAAEAEARKEANAKRDEYIGRLAEIESLIVPVKPDPRAFGYGTQSFNRAAYDAAVAEYNQDAGALAQLKEQRDALEREQKEEYDRSFGEWKEGVERQFMPKLLEAIPDLKVPEKSGPMVHGLIKYAIESGIPDEIFSPERQGEITSAQLLLIWKAQQYDKVKAGAVPKPKPASPGVKPGVSSPQSAQKAVRVQKDMDRLAREGSIEAGAAMFKHAFKR